MELIEYIIAASVHLLGILCETYYLFLIRLSDRILDTLTSTHQFVLYTVLFSAVVIIITSECNKKRRRLTLKKLNHSIVESTDDDDESMS